MMDEAYSLGLHIRRLPALLPPPTWVMVNVLSKVTGSRESATWTRQRRRYVSKCPEAQKSFIMPE